MISRFLGPSTGKYYATATSFIIIFVAVIIIVYIRIYRLAQRHHSQIHCMSQHSSTIARENKVTKTTAYIVGSVLICYSPLLVSLFAVKFFEAQVFHYYVFPITDWRNADLRRCIAKLLGIQVRREKVFWSRSGRSTSLFSNTLYVSTLQYNNKRKQSHQNNRLHRRIGSNLLLAPASISCGSLWQSSSLKLKCFITTSSPSQTAWFSSSPR